MSHDSVCRMCCEQMHWDTYDQKMYIGLKLTIPCPARLSQNGYFFWLCPYQRPSRQVALHLQAERLIACTTANPNSCIKSTVVVSFALQNYVQHMMVWPSKIQTSMLWWSQFPAHWQGLSLPVLPCSGARTAAKILQHHNPFQHLEAVPLTASQTPVACHYSTCNPSRLPCKDPVAPQQFQHAPKNTVSQKNQPKHQNHRTTKPTDMVSKWPTSWGKPS